MAKKRMHVKIHGYVQGVFFRSNAQKQAGALGLKGWVKNTVDSCVEIVAEGEESSLKKLLAWCNEWPSAAQVEEVEVEWGECKNEFEQFSIKY